MCWICSNFNVNFLQRLIHVYLFSIHNEHYSIKTKEIQICPCSYKLMLIMLSAHVFSFYFYAWPYTLNVRLFSSNLDNIFSITIRIFHNLVPKSSVWANLQTCLKCSIAFFRVFLIAKRGAKHEIEDSSSFLLIMRLHWNKQRYSWCLILCLSQVFFNCTWRRGFRRHFDGSVHTDKQAAAQTTKAVLFFA